VAQVTPAPTVTSQTVGQRLQIANTGGEGVNLRRDAGSTGERIKTLTDGTLVEIVGPDRNIDGTVWRNVRDLQGDVGWVAGGFLAVEGSAPVIAGPVPGASGTSTTGAAPAATTQAAAPKPTSPGVAASTASRGQVGNTNGQGANIRSEPGSNGRVLKTVPEGTNLEVVGQDREVDGQVWRQVRDSSGVTGWIIRGAVAPAGSVPTPAPAAPAAKPTSGSGAPAATQAPAAKPTSGSGAPAATQAPAATSAPSAPQPTAGPTRAPGNLPIIIQPATPRPGGGTAPKPTAPAPAATPKPSN
jgi:SH3-like domain-containing protein